MRRNIIEPILVIIGLCLIVVRVSGAMLMDYSQSGSQNQVSEKDFIEWMKERAIPLDTLDLENWDLSALSPLDKEIEEKRVVYLSDPDPEEMMVSCFLPQSESAHN